MLSNVYVYYVTYVFMSCIRVYNTTSMDNVQML